MICQLRKKGVEREIFEMNKDMIYLKWRKKRNEKREIFLEEEKGLEGKIIFRIVWNLFW